MSSIIERHSRLIDQRVEVDRSIREQAMTRESVIARIQELERKQPTDENSRELFRSKDKLRHIETELAALQKDRISIEGEIEKVRFQSEYEG